MASGKSQYQSEASNLALILAFANKEKSEEKASRLFLKNSQKVESALLMETPDETGDRAIGGENLIASKRMKTLRQQGKNSSNDEWFSKHCCRSDPVVEPRRRNSRYGMKTREVRDLASELEDETEGLEKASKL